MTEDLEITPGDIQSYNKRTLKSYHAVYIFMTEDHACLHVCMYLCVYVCMYICIYVYTYICIYVYMYICIYVYVGAVDSHLSSYAAGVWNPIAVHNESLLAIGNRQ